MKFLFDVNLTPQWIPYLRDHYIEASHWSTIGRVNAPDIEICKYAAENSLCIVTNDLDFGELLARQKTTKPSIIQIRVFVTNPTSAGRAFLEAINTHREALDKGAIITILPLRTKATMLPIGNPTPIKKEITIVPLRAKETMLPIENRTPTM